MYTYVQCRRRQCERRLHEPVRLGGHCTREQAQAADSGDQHAQAHRQQRCRRLHVLAAGDAQMSHYTRPSSDACVYAMPYT
eukprot:COSAG02_NODE_13026_length_1458_cov_1.272259_1_plen_81_part_00